MDPVTHTLVGGSLAATRLGSRTRLASAALVIGANFPDVDVAAFAWGVDAALGFRRGWTHGVLALAILPLLLAALLRGWARLCPPKAADPPLSPAWLAALCYVGVLSHPALDWLNVYGMRWLMPFDGTWFYGDTLFIVDPWLWLLLGSCWLAGRRRSWRLALLVGAPGAFLLVRTLLRAPEFALAVAAVVALLLGCLYWQPRRSISPQRAAGVGLLLGAGYVAAMLALHAVTEARVRGELAAAGLAPVDSLMVAPLPANPLAWDVVFTRGDTLRGGRYRWLGGGELILGGFERRTAATDELWPRIVAGGEPAGFLTWTRFPWIETATAEEGGGVYIMDARYTRGRTTGFGGTRLDELPAID